MPLTDPSTRIAIAAFLRGIVEGRFQLPLPATRVAA